MPLAGRRTNLTHICLYTILTSVLIYALTMPFRQQFQSLLNKAEQAFNEHGQHNAQAPPSNNPPPIPTSSKPHFNPSSTSPSSTPTPYWAPSFDTQASVTTHFRHEIGQHGWGNAEAQNYVSSPSNSFHSANNTLSVRALIDSSAPSNDRKYTSARLTSHQTLSRPRGCLSVHITAPVATGIWPAFWLLPADPFTWPTDGEVDIFESWDGDGVNHSCLHWGFFDGNDWDKHRVQETGLTELTRGGHRFDFVWDEDEGSGQGRLVWYVDGRAVMKASKPPGTRRMRDFRLLVNIAVGGNVCKGHMPRDGSYEMVLSGLGMYDAPPAGWDGFERDWKSTREGHTS